MMFAGFETVTTEVRKQNRKQYLAVNDKIPMTRLLMTIYMCVTFSANRHLARHTRFRSKHKHDGYLNIEFN